ncbi:hypothetical protein TrVE_jg12859 [Triparma verrucosa]|uniref:PUM-HD domain-containing protein n=1 Tax=Triparma verrucosa TaxID=1606542 RepID=A0A9W7CGK3_9STRA|nr:hypothetical protein TrVE_jg12859 [Triparma verrucosa]
MSTAPQMSYLSATKQESSTPSLYAQADEAPGWNEDHATGGGLYGSGGQGTGSKMGDPSFGLSLPLPPSSPSSGLKAEKNGNEQSLDSFLGSAVTSSLNLNDPPKSPITDSTWTPDEVNAGAAEYVPQSNYPQYGYGAQDMSQMGMGGDQGQWGYEQQGGQPQIMNAQPQTPNGIFYMAVNVGGQQVLQPVQIVQLPNGQMATVLANPPGMAAGQQDPYGWSDASGKPRKGKRSDDLKVSPDLSPLHVETPADLAVDNQSSDLHALYGSSRRPPLKDLLGNVRRLSKDQVGCRLLQQSLDEDGPEASTAIITEALPFMAEIMTDPFGNYLFQKILEKCDDEERMKVIRGVSTSLVKSSLNLHGTRSVQKVVEMCSFDPAAAACVTKALAPQAARLCIDANGNHVIQRVLQRLPHQHARFVFDAVAASVGEVARHRHGCCVIQRCLDSPKSPARSNLVAKIVEKALELMQDAYGNYVVQYVLDVCSEEEASAVCESVTGRVGMLAIQKFSSNVMEKCLEKANDKTQEAYLRELSHPEKIKDLMSDPFGNYVVQRGLAVATHAQAVRLVEAMRPHLGGMRNTAGGRRIVSKICRRFPNFNAELGSSMKQQQNEMNMGGPQQQQQQGGQQQTQSGVGEVTE